MTTDLYDLLLARPDVIELPSRELTEGMSLIGTRETVVALEQDAVAVMAGASADQSEAEIVDFILGRKVPLEVVAHGFFADRGIEGVRCGFLRDGLYVDIFIGHEEPVLVWVG